MELTWSKVLAGGLVGGFTLAGAVATATWALRADRIEDLESRVAFYEKADTLKLLNMLESLEKSNSRLTEQLSRLTDYVQTKEENAKLVALVKEKEEQANVESSKRKDRETELLNKISAVEKDRLRVTTELKDKVAYIERLYPTNEKFTLPARTSKSIAGFNIVIGLVAVNRDRVQLSYNNDKKELWPGNYIEDDIGDNKCRLILDSIEWNVIGSGDNATFTFICSPASQSNKASQGGPPPLWAAPR
jgi:uncharacterized coiled-coil protein SlyX